MKFNLKNKILFILLILPLCSLYYYKSFIVELIEKDKLAYVYDTTLNTAKSKSNSVNSLVSSLNLAQSVLTNRIDNLDDINLIYQSLITANKNIQSIVILEKFEGEYESLILKKRTKKKYDFKYANSLLLEGESSDWDIKFLQGQGLYLFKRFQVGSKKFGIVIEVDESLINKAHEENMYSSMIVDLSQKDYPKNLKPFYTDKSLVEATKKKSGLQGVVKKEINETVLVMAYSKIFGSTFLLTLVEEEKTLSVLQEVRLKSYILFLVIIGCSGVFAILFSRKITSSLSELMQATFKIKKGNYKVKIHKKSNDEIGDLANSFEEMGDKINKLLMKLKLYNEKLELLVAKRTSQLKETLNLQEAMVDSLSEGLLVFDKKGQVSNIASKVCDDIFGVDPRGKFLGDILKTPQEEYATLEDLCSSMLNEDLPFADMAVFMPNKSLAQKDKDVIVDYAPIRNEDGVVTGAVLIANDKTAEFKAIAESEKEKVFVKHVIKVLSDKERFITVFRDILNYLNIFENEISYLSYGQDRIFRDIHTFKGQAALFQFSAALDLLHEFEDLLAKETSVSYEKFLQFKKELIDSMEEYSKEQMSWIGVNLLSSHYEKKIELREKDIKEFVLKNRNLNSKDEILNNFVYTFQSTYIKDFLEPYRSLVKNLSDELMDFPVNYTFEGEDIKLLNDIYKPVFDSFVHIFKNMFTHAFDPKCKENQISIYVEKDKIRDKVLLKIKDNGHGIDIEKIRSKVGAGENVDAKDLLKHIFKDEFSTADSLSLNAGRGVGLSAVKEQVEKIGGKVYIATKVGLGTMFIIEMPVHKVQSFKKEQVCKLVS